jgi:L-lysine 2,3-aminomutase
MITASPCSRQSGTGRPAAAWQHELAQAISDPVELCRTLGLDPQLALAARAAGASFALRVPRGFVRRMRSADPADPLLRQVLPKASMPTL